jgi:tetratricopeptide (TPR) repeat protein
LLIAIGVFVSVTLSLILIPADPFYWFGPFAGFMGFLPTFMLLTRRTSDKVQPLFEQAAKQAQAGNVPKAVESFQQALEFKRWQFFLEKQVNTQVGILHYGAGDEAKAVEHLQKGYPKVSEGHLILGTVLYRQKKLDDAVEALELGITFNKKSPIIYNLLAWILNKEGKTAEAIEVLNRCLKKVKSDEETSENLNRLQNGKKMNMKPFGQLWYMLKFETPKGMAAAPQVRKGFRAPPKGKGKARAKKARK